MTVLGSRTIGLLLLIISTPRAVAIPLDINDTGSIRAAAATVANGLMKMYNGNQTGGVMGKFPYPPYYWWESGAAFGGMVEYWHYTGDVSYNNVTWQALVSQISPTNDFMPVKEQFDEGNDDQAFWALAAMSAAEYGFPPPPSSYPSWLAICENVFADFLSRWNISTCNGGLKWQIFQFNAGYEYKNAIANGALFQLSSRLARYTGNQTYVDWANKAWNWTVQVGLLDNLYHVYDGTSDTLSCTEVDHGQWSYNVGVFLYGAAILQNYTNGSTIWTTRTAGLLEATATFFSPFKNSTSIMFEAACETSLTCDVDQYSMKAYLSRWLAGTSQMAPFTQAAIAPLLRASALGASRSCSGGMDNETCGAKWYAEAWDGTSGVGQQLSAMEVMYALLANSTQPPMSQSNVHIGPPPVLATTVAPPAPTASTRPLYDKSAGNKPSVMGVVGWLSALYFIFQMAGYFA